MMKKGLEPSDWFYTNNLLSDHYFPRTIEGVDAGHREFSWFRLPYDYFYPKHRRFDTFTFPNRSVKTDFVIPELNELSSYLNKTLRISLGKGSYLDGRTLYALHYLTMYERTINGGVNPYSAKRKASGHVQNQKLVYKYFGVHYGQGRIRYRCKWVPGVENGAPMIHDAAKLNDVLNLAMTKLAFLAWKEHKEKPYDRFYTNSFNQLDPIKGGIKECLNCKYNRLIYLLEHSTNIHNPNRLLYLQELYKYKNIPALDFLIITNRFIDPREHKILTPLKMQAERIYQHIRFYTNIVDKYYPPKDSSLNLYNQVIQPFVLMLGPPKISDLKDYDINNTYTLPWKQPEPTPDYFNLNTRSPQQIVYRFNQPIEIQNNHFDKIEYDDSWRCLLNYRHQIVVNMWTEQFDYVKINENYPLYKRLVLEQENGVFYTKKLVLIPQKTFRHPSVGVYYREQTRLGLTKLHEGQQYDHAIAAWQLVRSSPLMDLPKNFYGSLQRLLGVFNGNANLMFNYIMRSTLNNIDCLVTNAPRILSHIVLPLGIAALHMCPNTLASSYKIVEELCFNQNVYLNCLELETLRDDLANSNSVWNDMDSAREFYYKYKNNEANLITFRKEINAIQTDNILLAISGCIFIASTTIIAYNMLFG